MTDRQLSIAVATGLTVLAAGAVAFACGVLLEADMLTNVGLAVVLAGGLITLVALLTMFWRLTMSAGR